MARLFVACLAVAHALYDVRTTYGVTYARGLTNCTNGTDCLASRGLTLDLYEPVGAPGLKPLLVVIHGGSYCILDSNETGEVAQARYFAARGYVAASINYRLSGDRGNYPAGAGAFEPLFNASSWYGNNYDHMYPAVRDAKAAIRYLRSAAADLGVDGARVAASGSSAGATSVMALVAADEADFKDEEADDPTLASTHVGESSRIAAALSQWGAAYGVEVLEWLDGRPRVAASSPPLLAFAGTNDTVIVPANSEWLCARYAAVGATCALRLLAGAGHGAWNATVAGRSQNDLAFDFFSRHL